MSVINIHYTVPVSVYVDTDTKTVQSVHVWDECLGAPEACTYDDMTGRSVPKRIAAKAVQIAEESDDWPAWEFGA